MIKCPVCKKYDKVVVYVTMEKTLDCDCKRCKKDFIISEIPKKYQPKRAGGSTG